VWSATTTRPPSWEDSCTGPCTVRLACAGTAHAVTRLLRCRSQSTLTGIRKAIAKARLHNARMQIVKHSDKYRTCDVICVLSCRHSIAISNTRDGRVAPPSVEVCSAQLVCLFYATVRISCLLNKHASAQAVHKRVSHRLPGGGLCQLGYVPVPW
jgi:hypothetical protein